MSLGSKAISGKQEALAKTWMRKLISWSTTTLPGYCLKAIVWQRNETRQWKGIRETPDTHEKIISKL